VLPELRHVNSALDASITRLSKVASEEDRFLNGMAAAALEQAEITLNGDLGFLSKDVEVSFRRSLLETLPAVLFRRAIRLAFEALGGPVDYDQTLKIQEGLTSTLRGSITAEGGTVVGEWTEDALIVRSLVPSVPYRYSLTIPGETISDEFGWKFVAHEKPFDQVFPVRASLKTFVDAGQMKGSLYFRTAKHGDTISPLGFPGTRKLSDLMSEAGLTLAARSRLPIVCDMLGPIWIPGVALSDRVKPKPETTKTLVISFEPLGTSDVRNI
jgi:tRNA(Ile)-lysidine synthase